MKSSWTGPVLSGLIGLAGVLAGVSVAATTRATDATAKVAEVRVDGLKEVLALLVERVGKMEEKLDRLSEAVAELKPR